MHSRRSIGDVINNHVWLCACVALVAAGVLGGCGGGDASTSTSVGGTVPAGTTGVAGANPEAVYQACLDALGGAVSQGRADNACAQVRDAFQQCATAASNAPEGSARDAAVKACQKEADMATSQLQASP
ncbi:MAG: hypothetical protein E6G49_07745 [Actinobacteria bacterium]|nr:MAG: hypothetical protein E6G49_07745 [Actinomycetota bacterium]